VKPVQVLPTVFWAEIVQERIRRMKTNMFAILGVAANNNKREREVGAPEVLHMICLGS
jgi:hypothetical protein